jgi:hypothetical protein
VAPDKGQKTYWDKSLSRFGFRLSQAGAKTWIIVDPRSKIRGAGDHRPVPLIHLKTARGEAKTRLANSPSGRSKRVPKLAYRPHRGEPAAGKAMIKMPLTTA